MKQVNYIFVKYNSEQLFSTNLTYFIPFLIKQHSHRNSSLIPLLPTNSYSFSMVIVLLFPTILQINQNYLQALLHPMTAIPSPSLSYPSNAHPEFFLKEQLETMCEFEDELYHPSYWNFVFSGFVFERLVAETDNSLVWIGKYRNSCETVALKITEIFETETSEKMHQMKENAFLQEYHMSHMVEVKEIINAQGFRMIAMKEYPWNLTHLLKQFTNTTKRYSQEHFNFVIFVFKGIICALQEIHSLGYVHRDLKPDNFLLDSTFNLFITDFGLVTKQLEIDTSSSGTLEYLAPQRLSKRRRQNPVKKSVDVWALGIILYELLTGDNPFNGDNQEEILDSICEGFIRNKEISSVALSLINGILEVNADKRLTLENIKNHPLLQKEVDRNAIIASLSNCL